MSRDFPVTGLNDIMQNLSALGKRIEGQAIRSGLTVSAAVVRDEARIRAKGRIPSAIKSGSSRKNQDGTFSIRVYVDERKYAGAYTAFFQEYGVKPHMIPKAPKGGKSARTLLKIGDKVVTGPVQHPGHAAHPFLRPALDTKADDAIRAFRDKIIAVVENKTGFRLDAGLDEAA